LSRFWTVLVAAGCAVGGLAVGRLGAQGDARDARSRLKDLEQQLEVLRREQRRPPALFGIPGPAGVAPREFRGRARPPARRATSSDSTQPKHSGEDEVPPTDKDQALDKEAPEPSKAAEAAWTLRTAFMSDMLFKEAELGAPGKEAVLERVRVMNDAARKNLRKVLADASAQRSEHKLMLELSHAILQPVREEQARIDSLLGPAATARLDETGFQLLGLLDYDVIRQTGEVLEARSRN
jgi:hypothetical protein